MIAMKQNFIFRVVIFMCVSASAASAASPDNTVLRAFTSGSASASSYGPLVADRAGDLFGTASAGGNRGCIRYASTGCGTVFELTPPAAPGGVWTEHVLYRFPGGSGPWMPTSGLTMDPSGGLFGTTTDGGPYDCFTTYCGTAFELKPPSRPGRPWTEIVLYRFSAGVGGNNPDAGLTLDGAGDLYGTTLTYGPNDNGTVYRLSPPARSGRWWTETVLSGFERGGLFPIGGVVFDNAGDLYGTTFYGGFYNLGLVYKLTPAPTGRWKETVLYQFGSNACSPKTDLIIDAGGNLYGTGQGCPALPGAVFRLSPPAAPGGHWTEAVLSYFYGTSNYDPATSLTMDAAGDLYGSTASGGTHGDGTVFQLKPPAWTATVLHSFDVSNGEFPTAGPVFGNDGALYGVTLDGGYRGGICKFSGCGVIYRVAP
jgi:uncharacterized repeat protein (TIGR03803 family)